VVCSGKFRPACLWRAAHVWLIVHVWLMRQAGRTRAIRAVRWVGQGASLMEMLPPEVLAVITFWEDESSGTG
jgi:hypothetical protein